MKIRKSKSFGLIETVVAIGILTMVIGSTAALGVTATHGVIIAKHKTEAYHVAQDAMDQIKGERDGVWDNWSETNNVTWSSFWQNDFRGLRNKLNSQCVFISNASGDLKEQSCGSSLPDYLRFKRTVSDKEDVSALILGTGSNGHAYKITIEISWQDYGKTHSVSIASHLTDWQPRY